MIRVWLLFLVSALALASEVRAESLADRFLREAPVKWEQYRKFILGTRGTKKVCQYDCVDSRKLVTGTALTFVCLDEGDVRVIAQDLQIAAPGASPWTSDVTNARYRFKLSAPSYEGPWVIKDLRFDRFWHAPDDLIGRSGRVAVSSYESVIGASGPFAVVARAVCAAQVLDACWLPRIVSSKDFKLVAATALGDFVKVDYLYKPTVDEANRSVRSGFVVVDPKNYWIIRSAKVKAQWGWSGPSVEVGTETYENTLDEHSMPFPFVKRQVFHTSCAKSSVDGKPVECEVISEIELHRATDATQEEFTLAAFGLSEPRGPQFDQGTPPSQGRPVLIVLLIALAVLVVVFIVRRRRLRQET